MDEQRESRGFQFSLLEILLAMCGFAAGTALVPRLGLPVTGRFLLLFFWWAGWLLGLAGAWRAVTRWPILLAWVIFWLIVSITVCLNVWTVDAPDPSPVSPSMWMGLWVFLVMVLPLTGVRGPWTLQLLASKPDTATLSDAVQPDPSADPARSTS